MKTTAATALAVALSLGAAVPAHADINDGVVAFWPFDDCSLADASGNGNDGTAVGAPQCVAGRLGTSNSAYRLDGLNDFINIGDGVKPPLPLTINAYIRPEALPINTGHGIFRNDAVNSGGNRYGAELIVGADYFEVLIFNGFASSLTRRGFYTTQRAAVIDQWQMVTAVIKSVTDMEIYWNGVKQDVVPDNGTAGYMAYSGASGALGDGDAQHSADDRRFEGAIDDVRVYNRALTQDEINALVSGVPYPICELTLTADTYALGDTIRPETLRIGNLGEEPVCFELKLWLFNHSTSEATSLFKHPKWCWDPGNQRDFAGVPILAIPASDLGIGTHEYNCRILDRVTGAQQVFDQNVFTVE